MKTFFLAKLIRKMQLSSFRDCSIDNTSKVASACSLTRVCIGKYSYLGEFTHATDADIGNFCSIGSYCNIGGGVHPINYVSTSPAFLSGKNIMGVNFSNHPCPKTEKVIIGNDVWIGNDSYIKAGVRIGDGAIIGAHSVVTHDVGPYEIVAGVPARVIRKRFDDETIKRFLEIEWWNMDYKQLQNMAPFFNSPQKLLECIEKEGLKK